MQVFVNDKEVQTQALTLSSLLAEQDLPAQGIAAAVGNRLVPRSEWKGYVLTEGCRITIIKAACGG